MANYDDRSNKDYRMLSDAVFIIGLIFIVVLVGKMDFVHHVVGVGSANYSKRGVKSYPNVCQSLLFIFKIQYSFPRLVCVYLLIVCMLFHFQILFQ
jgi:hypothetical protein